jgi:DNA (cytosine-5)-methyltransferase 1
MLGGGVNHPPAAHPRAVPAPLPAIDVFAGPGGLGEGFAALRDDAGRPRFELALSIERDGWAHRTLTLRALVRRLGGAAHPDVQAHLRGTLPTDGLFDRHPAAAAAARAEAWHAELGAAAPGQAAVRDRIDAVLRGRGEWVLIGGPPCQAYSTVGRSRNRGIDGYRFEDDHRSTLYVEYLQQLADHRPAVFVMENVKGLLSARRNGEPMFGRIVGDLRDPCRAIAREGRPARGDGRPGHPQYELYPIAAGGGDGRGESFAADHGPAYVVRAEDHGVPQARHRVIVVGVRRDFTGRRPRPLAAAPTTTVRQVIGDLPPLRSGLSGRPDDAADWAAAVGELSKPGWHRRVAGHCGDDVAAAASAAADRAAARAATRTRGGERVDARPGRGPHRHRHWYATDAVPCVADRATSSDRTLRTLGPYAA